MSSTPDHAEVDGEELSSGISGGVGNETTGCDPSAHHIGDPVSMTSDKRAAIIAAVRR